jgi:hypothetical protein
VLEPASLQHLQLQPFHGDFYAVDDKRKRDHEGYDLWVGIRGSTLVIQNSAKIDGVVCVLLT